jgi:hypothetical protein
MQPIPGAPLTPAGSRVYGSRAADTPPHSAGLSIIGVPVTELLQ